MVAVLQYKKIRSTIQRCRLSKKQQEIFNNRSQHCIFLDHIVQINSNLIDKIFNNHHPLILDLGFGNGDQLIDLATNFPNNNFIGIELYKKGIVNVINNINTKNLVNIKVIFGDAKEILEKFQDRLLNKIQIFFPDPWPKLRHHKRRLLQKDFLDLIANKLILQGMLHVVTDSLDYINHITKILLISQKFIKMENTITFRTKTKFENIALSKGKNIYELIYQLNPLHK